MDIIFVTIPVTLIFIAVAVAVFFWATRNGQYDDMEGPANRILFDDEPQNTASTAKPQNTPSTANPTSETDDKAPVKDESSD